MAANNKVLFEKDGVFIHTTVAKADEDALVSGKIFLFEKPEGIFVQWKPSMEEDEGGGGNDGWAVVDAVAYKNDNASETESLKMSKASPPKKPSGSKYVINFELKELKSLKRSRPNLGWSYIIFILKCGTTCPALHFHQGGTKALMRELEKYLTIKRSPLDSCLYLVRESNPEALSQSFDELQLFEDHSGDIITKFIKDPYTTTWGGFSKVTNFLKDALLLNHEAQERPRHEVAEILSEDVEGVTVSQEEPGFEMVTRMELPEREKVRRYDPVTPQQWSQYMDTEGRIQHVDHLKDDIFRGGLDPTIRIEVWKFLLGYYTWDSTYKQRADHRKKRVDDYFRMKLQWKSVTPDQERRFSQMKERKNLIDKDVTRTDRTHAFFQGEENPNLQVLYDILMTYCMYNFDLGYVQGMSDLLAPILVVMENEVDAFWCFTGFMELLKENFEMSQQGMKDQLMNLQLLVKFLDPELCNFLESHESSNMYFCFRWLLIMFKREFSFPDIMRLWEVSWTSRPGPNFHLFICLAILDTEKSLLVVNNFGFTEILKHINDMSGTIDLEDTLKKAESIYKQVLACKTLPDSIREIMKLPNPSGPETAAPSAATSMNNIPNGTVASTPSTPDKQRSLKIPGKAIQEKTVVLTSPSSDSGNTITTPDDSSIEILPEDHMDVIM